MKWFLTFLLALAGCVAPKAWPPKPTAEEQAKMDYYTWYAMRYGIKATIQAMDKDPFFKKEKKEKKTHE